MKYSQIIPMGYQVLVKPDPEESRETESGVILPENEEMEKKSFGEVIDFGDKSTKVEKGDKVVFGTYAGEDIALDDEEFKIVHEKFILAKLK